MATKYAISTEFSIVDRATAALDKMSAAGAKWSRALSGQMLAAEARVRAFGTMAQRAVVGAFGAAAGSAAVAIKQAIPLGMELEQNIGGTEAVFGKFAKNVQGVAESAYKNMGLSASDYMATANKMGSLFQGSGLSQVRAMDLTTNAMQRAADVASVMGIDTKFAMESIAGAAKGNFTMMDNLGVAMNATTLEAYALAKGMNFKWKTASNAQKAELAMKMFFERTQQYAGNFAREADETLSGSFGRMKTSVQDVLANMALGKSLDVPLQNMQDSVVAFTKNIVPTVVNIINSLPSIIQGIMSQVSPIISEALNNIRIPGPFGAIITGGLKLIQMLWGVKDIILGIGTAVLAWKGLMTGIFAATKIMQTFGIVSGFVKGIMLAQKAAVIGTTVAVRVNSAASGAAALGQKAYGLAVKIATGAQWLWNAAITANPIGLIIVGIAAAIAIIVVLISRIDRVRNAVDGFFQRIREAKGIGGMILQCIAVPFETVWNVLKGIGDAFAVFKSGGIIAGIKMLGVALLQGLATPLSYVFSLLAKIPGLGGVFEGLDNKIQEKIENMRASILTGVKNEDADSAAEKDADSANWSLAKSPLIPPTKSDAEGKMYSREESVTTNRLEVGLAAGLEARPVGKVAPVFSIYAGR